jgi:hypothetical protein
MLQIGLSFDTICIVHGGILSLIVLWLNQPILIENFQWASFFFPDRGNPRARDGPSWAPFQIPLILTLHITTEVEIIFQIKNLQI